MASLSMTTVIIGFLVIIVLYGVFQIYMLKDKVYCTYIRRDKTEVTKFEKLKAGKTVFDNGWYVILPDCMTLKMVWMGIFPTWVRCSKWKWDSKWPLNPNTWRNDCERPEDSAALDKTEDLRALFETQKATLGKGTSGKKSLVESLMPILMIAGIVIIGYLVYSQGKKMDMLGAQSNVLQQQLLDLVKALGK